MSCDVVAGLVIAGVDITSPRSRQQRTRQSGLGSLSPPYMAQWADKNALIFTTLQSTTSGSMDARYIAWYDDITRRLISPMHMPVHRTIKLSNSASIDDLIRIQFQCIHTHHIYICVYINVVFRWYFYLHVLQKMTIERIKLTIEEDVDVGSLVGNLLTRYEQVMPFFHDQRFSFCVFERQPLPQDRSC